MPLAVGSRSSVASLRKLMDAVADSERQMVCDSIATDEICCCYFYFYRKTTTNVEIAAPRVKIATPGAATTENGGSS